MRRAACRALGRLGAPLRLSGPFDSAWHFTGFEWHRCRWRSADSRAGSGHGAIALHHSWLAPRRYHVSLDHRPLRHSVSCPKPWLLSTGGAARSWARR